MAEEINWADVQKAEKPIAEGGFAKVFKGTYKGKPCAVKVWTLDEKALPEVRKLFMREIECNQTCDHPNVVKCYGGSTKPLALIMELVEGKDMFYFIHSRSKYTWGHVQDFLINMAAGMAHVHAKGILHRDLKTTNFLLSREGVVKVCDFGMGRVDAQAMTLGRGSARWVAPEVLRTTHYDQGCDVYSFGVVIWEVCTRCLPYEEFAQDDKILTEILAGRTPKIPSTVPPALANIMHKCWLKSGDRPTMADILKMLQSPGVIPPQMEHVEVSHDHCLMCKQAAVRAKK